MLEPSELLICVEKDPNIYCKCRTVEETEALVHGVESCGGGKWADIKKLGLRAIEKRSAVDLKDKWRNLQASSLPFDLITLLVCTNFCKHD